MKNLLGAALFLAIAAIVGGKLYERAKEMEWIDVDGSEDATFEGGATQQFSYPDTVQLSNRDGRVLQVTLMGRSRSHVQFRRAGDSQPFVYAIDQLDAASEKLVMSYPESGLQNATRHLKSGEMELADIHIENLHKEIRRIDQKCELLRKKHSGSTSETERRTLQNEYEELEKQRIGFEEDLAEYQSQ
ncbi:MAG: hypothetical protein ACPGKS_03435 [Coraliomargarita sp.]